MCLTLSIVDNVLTVYDVRGRRKFRFERRCNCLTSNVAIDNVSPDFTSAAQYLDLKTTGEIAENWKLWKEKYNNYFVISRLDRENCEYQLAVFKHAIGDDGLKVIKSFTYSEVGNANDSCVLWARWKSMTAVRLGLERL